MTQRLSILAVSALLGALALPAVAQKTAADTSGATMESSPGKATLRHERTSPRSRKSMRPRGT